MLLSSVTIRRIRFWLHLTSAYFSKYRFRIMGVVLTLVGLFFLSFKVWSYVVRSNYISVGYVGAYSIENIPSGILSLATQSLIKVDPAGRPQSHLASHWTVSDDGKSYIIFLNDNLLWHDNTNVKASDISLAISDVQITALNNKTIEFKLPNPIASFPLFLDKPIFKINSFFGTGSYRIVDIDLVEGVVKSISLVPKDKRLPKVDINFYPTEEQAINALKIGDVKLAFLSSISKIENWPNVISQRSSDNSQLVTLFFNNEDGLLSSIEARQSLAYAINKSNLGGEENSSPVSRGNWAYNENVKKYEYNPAKAKELLNKVARDKIKISLSYSFDLEDQANLIANDWRSIGAEVELRKEKNVPSDFQVYLAFNKNSTNPDQYALWHSTQNRSNISRYKDVKIDKLLEDARTVQDEGKRRELYLDFQRFLIEDSPAVFLYHPYVYKAAYKNIGHLLKKLPPEANI